MCRATFLVILLLAAATSSSPAPPPPLEMSPGRFEGDKVMLKVGESVLLFNEGGEKAPRFRRVAYDPKTGRSLESIQPGDRHSIFISLTQLGPGWPPEEARAVEIRLEVRVAQGFRVNGYCTYFDAKTNRPKKVQLRNGICELWTFSFPPNERYRKIPKEITISDISLSAPP